MNLSHAHILLDWRGNILTVTLRTVIFVECLSSISRPSATTPGSLPGRSTFTSNKACSRLPMGPGVGRVQRGPPGPPRLIRQLQDQHLPLAEIRKQIEGLSQDELSQLAERVEDRAETPRHRSRPRRTTSDRCCPATKRRMRNARRGTACRRARRHRRRPPQDTDPPASAPNGSASPWPPKSNSTCDVRSRA